MFLINIAQFCNDTKELLTFVGWIITIFKIAIPLVIIIYGMIDFGKAVVAEKDDDIKKSAKTLLRRAIAGIIIFFVPAIVLWIFGQITDYSSTSGSFETCQNCLLHPGDC
jgi:Na+/proline symporter